MSYAQIKDGIVVNCIRATDEWVAEQEGNPDGFIYVKYTDDDEHPLAMNPFPGCTWDEVNQGFIPPPPDPDAPPPPIFLPSPEEAEIEEALSDILGF